MNAEVPECSNWNTIEDGAEDGLHAVNDDEAHGEPAGKADALTIENASVLKDKGCFRQS